MKKNEATATVNIDEAVEYLDYASDELQELMDLAARTENIPKDFIDKLKYAKEKVDTAWFDLPQGGADDIEDWKDIVISTLPDKASVAMANDVEEALEQFKNVY